MTVVSHRRTIRLFLLGAELLAVERKLGSFQDVAVGASALSRAGRDGSQKTSALEQL